MQCTPADGRDEPVPAQAVPTAMACKEMGGTMRALVVAVAMSTIVVVVWRIKRETESSAVRLERLRTRVDQSVLPQHVKHEMQSLLVRGRLRPSQYLASSDVPAGG